MANSIANSRCSNKQFKQFIRNPLQPWCHGASGDKFQWQLPPLFCKFLNYSEIAYFQTGLFEKSNAYM